MRPPTTVLALDNVPLELPIAGAGSRALAAFLDYLAVGIAMLLWSLALIAGLGLAAGNLGRTWAGVGFAVFLLGLFAIEYGYFAGSEVFTGGRTFGKWALSLQVTGADGSQASTSSLLLRNLVRSVDLVIGVPMMALDPLARRLGDRLGGTLVLAVPRSEPEQPPLRTPRGFGGREAAFLESLLRRADELPPERRDALAERTVNWIQRVDPGYFDGVDLQAGSLAALRAATDPAPGPS